MTTAVPAPQPPPASGGSRRPLAAIGHWLWGVAADLAIVLFTFLWCPLFILALLVFRSPRLADLCARQWGRWIVRACGIRIEVIGLKHIDPRRSYVIVSNHLSNFDVWASLASLPLRLRFVAKKELLRVPVFGQALALSDHIVIDRARPDDAITRINAKAAQLSQGFCILFFAEGTRSPDGKVHAFKKGGITLALQAQLPIIPMAVSGTRKFLPKGTLVIRPGGRVRIVLAAPVDTATRSVSDRDAVTAHVRQIVVENHIENY